MKKIIVILAFIFSNIAYTQNPNLGTSGAQFLEIPVGAKAAAMGGAFIGLAGDASSVFWNPAGITKTKSSAAHFSYLRWFEMFDMNAASVVYNAGDFGSLAASILVFSMDKMEMTTETSPNGNGRFFDAQDLAAGISYARNLTDRFSAGLTVKYIYQRIWNETAEGVAFDIGTQYRLDFNNFVIAMSMRNFGADMRYDGEDLSVKYDISGSVPLNRLAAAKLVTDSYTLPLNFQVGVSMNLYQSEFFRADAALDAIHPNDNRERINIGTQLTFFDRFFLRGGARMYHDDETFAFGAGVNLPVSDYVFNFDYAYSVYDLLPNVHRISVDIEF